jgi:predicted RNase H-like HicB family nuclease
MAKKVEEYIILPYVTEVVPEQCTDGTMCYRAYHPELLGCMSHGLTVEEAIENLDEARRLYIETLLEKGQEIPLPQSTRTGSAYQKVIWSVFIIPTPEKEKSIKKDLLELSPIKELTR